MLSTAWRTIAPSAAILFVTVSIVRSAETDVAFWLTVLHNTDGASQLVPADTDDGRGSVAHFARLIKSLKRQSKKAGSTVILLSSGESSHAGPELSASLQKGGRFYESLAAKRIKYDVMAFGNHDFDLGPDVLASFIRGIQRKKTHFVVSNLDFTAEPGLNALVKKGVIVSRLVVKRDGRRIGVVGSISPRLRWISSPGKVKVLEDVVARVQHEIDQLRQSGVNVIILLSEMLNIENDLSLARSLGGVDILVAGDCSCPRSDRIQTTVPKTVCTNHTGGDHILLSNPGTPLVPEDEDKVFAPYPLEAVDREGNGLLAVCTRGDHAYVGRLVVGFDSEGEVKAVDQEKSGPIRVSRGNAADSVKPDRKLERKVTRPVSQTLAALASEIVGTSEVVLDGRRDEIRRRETNMGNLVADALLAQAGDLATESNAPSPQVAIVNTGGVVAADVIHAGTLNRFDISRMLPFPNLLTIVPRIPAQQFKELVENAVSLVEFRRGRFPQIAGFRLTYDPAGTAMIIDPNGAVITQGTRVREITLDDGRKIVENGRVLPDAPSVDMATLDFLARGGDQYPFGNKTFVPLGITLEEAVRRYIQHTLGGRVTAERYPEAGEGRIRSL